MVKVKSELSRFSLFQSLRAAWWLVSNFSLVYRRSQTSQKTPTNLSPARPGMGVKTSAYKCPLSIPLWAPLSCVAPTAMTTAGVVVLVTRLRCTRLWRPVYKEATLTLQSVFLPCIPAVLYGALCPGRTKSKLNWIHRALDCYSCFRKCLCSSSNY